MTMNDPPFKVVAIAMNLFDCTERMFSMMQPPY